MESEFHLLIVDDYPFGTASSADEEIEKLEAGNLQVVIASHGNLATAIDAMRRGAFHYISKPVDVNLIRQLRCALENIATASTTDRNLARHRPAPSCKCEAPSTPPLRTLAEITEAAERAGIETALEAHDRHRELTAQSLGISVRTLHYKMNKYDMHGSPSPK